MNRFLTAFLGGLVIVLAVYGPVLLAEKIEAGEVETLNLVPTTTVIEQYTEMMDSTYIWDNETGSEWIWDNGTYIYYRPYLEVNGSWKAPSGTHLTVTYYSVGHASSHPALTYNYNGYRDSCDLTYSLNAISFYIRLRPSEMTSLNTNQFFFWTGGDMNIKSLAQKIVKLQTDGTSDGEANWGFSGTVTYSGGNYYYNFTSTQMSNMNTWFNGYSNIPAMRIDLELWESVTAQDNIYFDMQFNPQYYEIEENVPDGYWNNWTTPYGYWDNETWLEWNNQTSITYTPHYSRISNPFYLTRLSLVGSSGILAILTFMFWRSKDD